jgi:hypothetical protein
MLRTLSGLALTVALVGCQTAPKSAYEPSPGATSSEIRHVVLVSLADSTQADELIADMDRLVRPIPGIVGYWRGTKFISGRSEVALDYDVGLVIDLKNAAAYDNYVADPRHVELVQTWKPRATSIRIYDIAPQATDALASRPPR